MREKLLQILSETCPGVDFAQETALIDDGILDSLDLVTLVTQMMDVFQVELDVEDLEPEHFNSVDAMLSLIESRK